MVSGDIVEIKYVRGDGWWIRTNGDERHSLSWPHDTIPHQRMMAMHRRPNGLPVNDWTRVDRFGRLS